MKSETYYCVVKRKGKPYLKIDTLITKYIRIFTDEYRPYIEVFGKTYLPEDLRDEIVKLMSEEE